MEKIRKSLIIEPCENGFIVFPDPGPGMLTEKRWVFGTQKELGEFVELYYADNPVVKWPEHWANDEAWKEAVVKVSFDPAAAVRHGDQRVDPSDHSRYEYWDAYRARWITNPDLLTNKDPYIRAITGEPLCLRPETEEVIDHVLKEAEWPVEETGTFQDIVDEDKEDLGEDVFVRVDYDAGLDHALDAAAFVIHKFKGAK